MENEINRKGGKNLEGLGLISHHVSDKLRKVQETTVMSGNPAEI
jgi:hypothetical protein